MLYWKTFKVTKDLLYNDHKLFLLKNINFDKLNVELK